MRNNSWGNRHDDGGIFKSFKYAIIAMILASAGTITFLLAVVDFFVTSVTMFADPGTVIVLAGVWFFAWAIIAFWTVFSKMEN